MPKLLPGSPCPLARQPVLLRLAQSLTVQTDERLNLGRSAIIDKLVCAEQVWLGRQPRELCPFGSVGNGAYTVLPVIVGHEIACTLVPKTTRMKKGRTTGPSEHRYLQLALVTQQLHHIFSPSQPPFIHVRAVLVLLDEQIRRAGLAVVVHDPTIDTPAQMLDETRVQQLFDGRLIWMDAIAGVEPKRDAA